MKLVSFSLLMLCLPPAIWTANAATQYNCDINAEYDSEDGNNLTGDEENWAKFTIQSSWNSVHSIQTNSDDYSMENANINSYTVTPSILKEKNGKKLSIRAPAGGELVDKRLRGQTGNYWFHLWYWMILGMFLPPFSFIILHYFLTYFCSLIMCLFRLHLQPLRWRL